MNINVKKYICFDRIMSNYTIIELFSLFPLRPNLPFIFYIIIKSKLISSLTTKLKGSSNKTHYSACYWLDFDQISDIQV